MSKYVPLKVLRETRRLVRILAGYTGEDMFQLVDRVVREEFERRGIPLPDVPETEDEASENE